METIKEYNVKKKINNRNYYDINLLILNLSGLPPIKKITSSERDFASIQSISTSSDK